MLRWILTLPLLLVLALLAGLFIWADHVADWCIQAALSERGLQSELSYGRVQVFANRLVLHGLRAGTWLDCERLTLNFQPSEVWNGRVQHIELEGGRLELEQAEQGLEAPGLVRLLDKLTDSTAASRASTLPMDTLRVSNLELQVKQAGQVLSPYPELVLNGQGQRQGPRFLVEGSLEDASAQLRLKLQGALDVMNAEVELKLALAKLEFLPGALQPEQLYRPLAGLITQTSGQLSGQAELLFHDGQLSSRATLHLQQLATQVAGLRVTGIDGSLEFEDLLEMRSAARQQLRIAELELAARRLKEGKLVFSSQKRGQLELHEASWRLGEGKLSIAPRTFTPAAEQPLRFTVLFEDIAIQELIGLDQGSLDATGVLGGAVPILIQDGKLSVDEGMLASGTQGVIRYRPPAGSAVQEEKLQMLLTLLENFHYDRVSIELSSPTANALEAALQLKGQNPYWEEGQPVVLNIRLQGDLMESILHGLKLYSTQQTLPQTLMEGSQ